VISSEPVFARVAEIEDKIEDGRLADELGEIKGELRDPSFDTAVAGATSPTGRC